MSGGIMCCFDRGKSTIPIEMPIMSDDRMNNNDRLMKFESRFPETSIKVQSFKHEDLRGIM